MSGYEIVKFLHVLAAILWLGGGMAMILLGWLHSAPGQRDAFMAIVRQVALLGTRLFMPGSIVVLLTGLGMVWLGGLGWPAWIVLGLAGIAFTALFGAIVLGGLANRSASATDPALALDLGRRLLRLAKFDYAIQFAIVWLMVTQPGWGDLDLLAPAGVLIVLGAVLFLRPLDGRTGAA